MTPASYQLSDLYLSTGGPKKKNPLGKRHFPKVKQKHIMRQAKVPLRN